VDPILIVANQTLGGAELERVIAARIAEGADSFHIVVPMIAPALEAVAWGAPEIGFVIPAPDPEAVDEARRRSEHRLAAIVDRIQALGGQAHGEVGDTDPVEAVRRVLEQRRYREVVVSTLPAGISRWLKLDLPSRVARLTDVPVTTVEAAGS
jgi:hypothetical protein